LDTLIKDYGEGEQTVLLLHGWGGTNANFAGVSNELQSHFRVITPDLWGFGLSKTPPSNFTIYDYAEHIVTLLSVLKIEKVHIIGHSFGGRIGIIMANRYPDKVKSLILLDSAGIRPRLTFAKKRQIRAYQNMKRLVQEGKEDGLELRRFGSIDYQELNNDMQQIFVSVVNEDLTNEIKNIKIPTMIVWGKKDTETPPRMAKKINRLIVNSKLFWLMGGHYAYLTEQKEFLKLCYKFWEEL